jgi:Cu-Zn family superoxide dismutase
MKRFTAVLLSLATTTLVAQTLTTPIYRTVKKGRGVSVGKITFVDKYRGLLIEPKLYGLKPGIHGFHVHVNPNCDNYGLAAGGHYDPMHTEKHLGPYNSDGHLGDMPALYVNKKGQSVLPVFAPRLHVRDLLGHSIMIHAGGDNYSDSPEKLGGGGKRIACVVIPKDTKLGSAAKKK